MIEGGKKHGDIIIYYDEYYIVEEVSVERPHLRCEGCCFKPGFRNKEDALLVIEHFKEILDKIFN